MMHSSSFRTSEARGAAEVDELVRGETGTTPPQQRGAVAV